MDINPWIVRNAKEEEVEEEVDDNTEAAKDAEEVEEMDDNAEAAKDAEEVEEVEEEVDEEVDLMDINAGAVAEGVDRLVEAINKRRCNH